MSPIRIKLLAMIDAALLACPNDPELLALRAWVQNATEKQLQAGEEKIRLMLLFFGYGKGFEQY